MAQTSAVVVPYSVHYAIQNLLSARYATLPVKYAVATVKSYNCLEAAKWIADNEAAFREAALLGYIYRHDNRAWRGKGYWEDKLYSSPTEATETKGRNNGQEQR